MVHGDGHHQLTRPAESGLSSEELLTRVGSGDEDAFSLLYDRLAGPVFGSARRLLRNRWHAEEVTQEVLLELWRTAGRYTPVKGSALNWALTMAHRRAVDRLRSEQAAAEREQRAAFDPSATVPFDEVAETAEHHENCERVRAGLRRLTALQRQSLVMAYYHGHSYREVADLLDRPIGTIKSRMRDGLLRLRDCLGNVA